MSLDIEAFYIETLNYFQNNVVIAIALAWIFLILLLRKPKLFFIIVLIVAVNVAVLLAISRIASAGIGQKNRLVHESVQQLTVN
jgi:hypothetical protein